MGILSSLFERRDTLAQPTDRFLEALRAAPTEAGVTVNESTAMRMVAVYSCVRVLSETIASLPLFVYERLDPRGKQRLTDHPLYSVLHDAPNPEMNSFTYWELVIMHLATWGNHYSEIVRRDGMPTELWPLRPDRISIKRNDRGALEYTYDGRTRFRGDQIFHIPLLGYNGLQGYSPISMARRAIGLGMAAEMYGARFFENDARPGIILSHPAQLSDEARQNLVESWQQRHGGVSNAWRAKVLEEGMSVSQVGIPPADAQFIEVRKFQIAEIARLYRIPPHLIADVERSTSWGTGIEQQNIGLIVYTLRPYLVRIERAIQQQLIPEFQRQSVFSEFLIDGLMRGDAASRTQFYQSGRQWGYLSANDVRELENRNPIDGGDIYLQPLNMIDVNQIDSLVEPDEQDRSIAITETREHPEGHETREQRSLTTRRRLIAAYQPVFADAIARTIRVEQQETRAQVRKSINANDLPGLRRWIGEYFNGKAQDRARQDISAPVQSLMRATVDEIAVEMDGDMISDAQLSPFVDDYVRVYGNRHAGASRSRLLKILNDYDRRDRRAIEDVADELNAEIDTWDDRSDPEGHDESNRSGNSAARWAYIIGFGVLALRWRTFGAETCPYCKELDGRRVSGGSFFLDAGAELFAGQDVPFISESPVGHPPLHSGCDCMVMPG